MNLLNVKVCRTCRAPKKRTDFYRHPHFADGRMNDCKECKKAYERDMRVLKRDTINARKRAYESSAAGKAARARYLANGGRTLYNEARRMNYRARRMDRPLRLEVAA